MCSPLSLELATRSFGPSNRPVKRHKHTPASTVDQHLRLRRLLKLVRLCFSSHAACASCRLVSADKRLRIRWLMACAAHDFL